MRRGSFPPGESPRDSHEFAGKTVENIFATGRKCFEPNCRQKRAGCRTILRRDRPETAGRCRLDSAAGRLPLPAPTLLQLVEGHAPRVPCGLWLPQVPGRECRKKPSRRCFPASMPASASGRRGDSSIRVRPHRSAAQTRGSALRGGMNVPGPPPTGRSDIGRGPMPPSVAVRACAGRRLRSSFGARPDPLTGAFNGRHDECGTLRGTTWLRSLQYRSL